LITWVSTLSAATIATTAGQYNGGSGTKTSELPMNVNGRLTPIIEITIVVMITAGLARLSRSGIRAVRMM
jgi:Mn2+/Fe2+ NRAMP family transporter